MVMIRKKDKTRGKVLVVKDGQKRKQIAETIRMAKITVLSYKTFMKWQHIDVRLATKNRDEAQSALDAVLKKVEDAPAIIAANEAIIIRLRNQMKLDKESPENKLKQLKEKIAKLEAEIAASAK